MPILAALIAACINGLTTFYGLALTTQLAMTWARRTFIIAMMAAFLLAVRGCVTGLLSQIAGFHAGGGLPYRFLMGLGMFIPTNAVAVLSCLGSVWLASLMLRLRLEGLRW